jgi:hypothetical protein
MMHHGGPVGQGHMVAALELALLVARQETSAEVLHLAGRALISVARGGDKVHSRRKQGSNRRCSGSHNAAVPSKAGAGLNAPEGRRTAGLQSASPSALNRALRNSEEHAALLAARRSKQERALMTKEELATDAVRYQNAKDVYFRKRDALRVEPPRARSPTDAVADRPAPPRSALEDRNSDVAMGDSDRGSVLEADDGALRGCQADSEADARVARAAASSPSLVPPSERPRTDREHAAPPPCPPSRSPSPPQRSQRSSPVPVRCFSEEFIRLMDASPLWLTQQQQYQDD